MIQENQDLPGHSELDPLKAPWLMSGKDSGDQETGEDDETKTGLEEELDGEAPKT